MNSIWGVFALPSENLPVAVLDSCLCEVPDDLSHEDRLHYATLELGGTTLSPRPCRWQVQLYTWIMGGGVLIPLSKFQNDTGVTLLGASPQPACEGGAFLDFIDPGETCGKSGTAQHSASRSPSALLRREEGVLCEVHLKGICGVTQVEPWPPAWMDAPYGEEVCPRRGSFQGHESTSYHDTFLHSAHTRVPLWLL